MRLGEQRWLPFFAGLFAVAAGLAGCAGMVAQREPLPSGLAQSRAVVPGLSTVRFWADETPANPTAAFRKIQPTLPRLAANAQRRGGRPVVDILALSGGGGDGAFGAGVLAGWTKRGDRPEFEVVTGVSAGAIIAPLAFLGPDYDDELKEVWTKYQTTDLVQINGLQGVLGGDALVDTSKLAELIAQYLSPAVMAEIAREYERGRILMVLTTNLDAQRPVVWNLGELARSRHPDAHRLFHKIIRASAAILGALSPVNIPVVVDGKTYDELHVDGGTTREVFISPIEVPLKALDQLYDRPPIRRIWLIKNMREQPIYQPVTQQTLPIAGRAISTLIHNQSAGEIYRIYRRALDAGAEFRMLAIPADFKYTST
jgi:predicted patatin/cPLA2 family phospholipase